jgi:hypothetical protein
LRQCVESTYFNSRLHYFTVRFIEAIDYVIENQTTINADIVRAFSSHALSTNRYLAGSTTKESPYEIEYCLQTAIQKWTKRESLITTALTEERNFHFRPADPWNFIRSAIPSFDLKSFDPVLVQLGVPRIYRHKPLYCVPLYHELGHFVDISNGVTNLSVLIQPVSSQDEFHHRLEHFADLFAACYVGKASIRALETIAAGHHTTPTHPATAARVALVEDLLEGRSNPLVALFQTCLQQLSLAPLTKEFSAPDISSHFDDVLTYKTTTYEELHGLFESAWLYFENALDNRSPPWIKPDTNDGDIERVINDLTEKSIRNASVRERWQHGATV